MMSTYQKIALGIYISSSVLIILSNLAIFFVIVFSPSLRSMTRSMLILGMAIADLLMGCFVTPLYTRSALEMDFESCHTNMALQVIGDHAVFFLVGWTLFTFDVIHIKKMSKRFSWKWPSLPDSVSTRAKGILLALWPWVAVLCTLVPLIITNSTPISFSYYSHHIEEEDILCLLSMPQSVVITASFLTLYLPFYLCVAALVTLVVCYSRGCHHEVPSTLTEDPNAADDATEGLTQSTTTQLQESAENPLWASIPNTVYLVCYMPLIVYTWLLISDIKTPHAVFGVVLFGSLARSFLLPLSWLVFPDINAEMRDYWKRFKSCIMMCASNPLPSSSTTVSFSRLQETQPA